MSTLTGRFEKEQWSTLKAQSRMVSEVGKARRVAQRDRANIALKAIWDRRQERLQQRRNAVDDIKLIETFARMWMKCDPNRGGIDPDALQPDYYESGSSDGPSERHANPQAGEPQWKWFVPRAQASLEFLRANGLRITR